MRPKITVEGLPENPTPEQIWKWAEHDNSNVEIQRINAAFRHIDDSKKWPINGRFNATERAINRLKRVRRSVPMYGLEYCYALEAMISKIVNEEV